MKPKLLLVADTYYPKVDGTLKFMEEFRQRAGKDFMLSFLVPDFGMHTGRNITYLEPSKFISLSGYPSLKWSWQNWKKIRTAICNTDLVFIQGPALISYLSMYYGHKYHKRTIFYLHVLSWELVAKFVPRFSTGLINTLIRKISVILYNRCDLILVPYHDLKEDLEKEGVTAPLSTAQLGVDLTIFTPSPDKKKSKQKMGIDENWLVIGYVGRISREKNTALLLRAFRRLKRPEKLFLLMVGDGPENQTKEFRKISHGKVTGFVSNVQDYLQAMDIFIMPSLTETTSLATLEAMATGLPVIVTPVGFMKRYVVNNQNGIFCSRNSPATLAAKIEQLLENPALRTRLGAQARKTVAHSFSWERSINRIKRLILRTSHSSRPQKPSKNNVFV